MFEISKLLQGLSVYVRVHMHVCVYVYLDVCVYARICIQMCINIIDPAMLR